jgi:sugar phosphate isomerase/epimerase
VSTRTKALSRREVLASAVAGFAVAAMPASGALAAAAPPPPARSAMGVTIASYTIRWGGRAESAKFPRWSGALDVLDHCHSLGAAGVQIGVRGWQSDFAGKVRERREALGMWLEGQVGVPADEGDVERFRSDLLGAREAGATILRCAIGGRRYEDFDTAEGFRRFRDRARRSLALAEPVAREHGVKLAVENHKDFRVPELLELLKHISSEHVGVTLDTGNSIALLEDPMQVVTALAPFTLTTHFKDMAVKEYADGFLLSEVPLGEGFLDLPGILAACRKANPNVRHNLEMITRDPLRVPCLTDQYWATFDGVPGRDLAAALSRVRANPPRQPLPATSGLSAEAQLALEEQHVRRCFAFARERLSL